MIRKSVTARVWLGACVAVAIGLAGATARAAIISHEATVVQTDVDNLSVEGSLGSVAPYGGTDWRVWGSDAANNVAPTVMLRAEKKDATNIGDISFTFTGNIVGTNQRLLVTWDASDSQSGVGGGTQGVFPVRLNSATINGRIDAIGAAGDVWFNFIAYGTTFSSTVRMYDSSNTLLATGSSGSVVQGNSNANYDVWFRYTGNTDGGSYLTYTVAGTGGDIKFGSTALNVIQPVPEPSTAILAGLGLLAPLCLRRRKR